MFGIVLIGDTLRSSANAAQLSKIKMIGHGKEVGRVWER